MGKKTLLFLPQLKQGREGNFNFLPQIERNLEDGRKVNGEGGKICIFFPNFDIEQ